MKRTNLFLFCLMASLPVFSQVDTIADNIYENNGNLGIGTSIPDSRLEVKGLIHSSDSGFKFPDGSIQTTAASPVNIPDLLTPSRIHIGDTSLLPQFSDGPVKIVTSGNLSYGSLLIKNPLSGVCTATDFYNDQDLRLTIGIGGSERPYGLERNCAFIYTSNQNSSTNIEGLVIGHRYSTAPIIFAQNNSEVLRITENGKVGIGTEKPRAKVEIADGDIYISDINRGIIMKSPDGQCWRGTLDNSGNLVFAVVDCLDDIQNPTETKSTIPVENISIFPNPADNSIIIGFLDKNFRNADAIIYTMDGKFVRKSELNSDHTSLSLNNLPSGSYIVRVLDKKGNELGSETMVKK